MMYNSWVALNSRMQGKKEGLTSFSLGHLRLIPSFNCPVLIAQKPQLLFRPVGLKPGPCH